MKLFFLFFLFAITVCCKPVFSQNTEKENVAKLQVADAVDMYNRYNADYVPVYNGESYIYYTMKMEGSPYFKSGDYSKGWVSYKGRKYDSLDLIYDITRDMLVTLYPGKSSSIIIQRQFIDSFFLQGHTFITLKEDHKQNLYNSGFYDLLYDGNVQFLALRKESLLTVIEGFELVTKFLNRTRFYIHKGGLYYMVNNKKDVFHLFKDKLRDLKRMMRRNHVKLKKKNFETSLIKVTAFYDQLSH